MNWGALILIGIAWGGVASRVDGPAPTYVIVICVVLATILQALHWIFAR